MTYSIVARDPETGELGVAVQSHWFAAGSTVPWAEAGVGAVATQAMAEVSYGPLGLALMRGVSVPPGTATRSPRPLTRVGLADRLIGGRGEGGVRWSAR